MRKVKRLVLSVVISVLALAFCFADESHLSLGVGYSTNSQVIGRVEAATEISTGTDGWDDAVAGIGARGWYQDGFTFETDLYFGGEGIFFDGDRHIISLGYSNLMAPSWFASYSSSFITRSGDIVQLTLGGSVLNAGMFAELDFDFSQIDFAVRFDYLVTNAKEWRLSSPDWHYEERDNNYRVSFDFGYNPIRSHLRLFCHGEYNWAENLFMTVHDNEKDCMGHNKKVTEITPLRPVSVTFGAQLKLDVD